jgi:hypothetical protein
LCSRLAREVRAVSFAIERWTARTHALAVESLLAKEQGLRESDAVVAQVGQTPAAPASCRRSGQWWNSEKLKLGTAAPQLVQGAGWRDNQPARKLAPHRPTPLGQEDGQPAETAPAAVGLVPIVKPPAPEIALLNNVEAASGLKPGVVRWLELPSDAQAADR